ncbi:Hsp20 family protein [Pseudomonas sp. GX19020]|uniref:Hsp20 family protein n=1 Tax=Pseudomonas sp. GX19020 TaxID=2942277 RepID=UPI0020189661|nr:Hsp20 family protein [Pseudomonas sp. GX19020]MCL4069455.1 Hsp20 family protein [Pseudomonas sp. GX19020]
MRTTFDFTPLFRSSVGFDRLLTTLEAATRSDAADSWPPYDIARLDEDRYRITMAVAGFREGDLTLTQDRNVLIITGRKEGEDKAQYLHRGIPARAFERRFELADHVRVEGASLTDGLLEVSLTREIPEEKKPRRIEIVQGSDAAGADLPRIGTARVSEKQPEPVAA